MRSALMELTPTTAAVVASVLGLTLGAWFAVVLRRARDTRRAREHNKRGKRAEQAAARLLEANGYRVVARQDRKTYLVREGATDRPVELIIDFIVEKGGERLPAEVKSGGAAVGIERADTRRQLLEYQLALGCQRVLLVDPERSLITVLAFPIPRPEAKAPPKPRVPSLAAAVVTLLLVAAAVAAWATLR